MVILGELYTVCGEFWWRASVFFRLMVLMNNRVAFAKWWTTAWRASSVWAKSVQSWMNSSSRISLLIVLLWAEATESKDTSICSERHVDVFSQFFLSLSHHHAKEDGKEFKGQHVVLLFPMVKRSERLPLFDLTQLAYVDFPNDSEELWWAC